MDLYLEIPPDQLTAVARDLLANEDRPENEFRLGPFMPDETTEDIYFEFDAGPTRTFTNAMQYRSWTTEAPIGSREGRVKRRGEIPPLSEKYPLTELDRIRQRAARRGSSFAEAALEDVFDDIARGIRAARARNEISRAEALITGALSISHNGLSIDVDFGRSASREDTVATSWSDAANATHISDEEAVVDTMSDGEGLGPDQMWAVLNRKTMRYLKGSAQYRSYWPTVRELDSIPVEAVNQVRDDHDLPPLAVYNAAATNEAGVNAKLIPDDRVLYIPRNAIVGETVWGVAAMADEAGFELDYEDRPGVIAYTMRSLDPLVFWTMVEGVGLPILKDPDATFVLDVS